MGAIFVKKSSKKIEGNKKVITSQEKAILDLKNQRDRLHKYTKQVHVFFLHFQQSQVLTRK